jgi:ABC-type branched-subunit amino acid transport system ATPase component
VALAALLIEGGRQFLPGADEVIVYGAPLGLIFMLTRYRSGLNGVLSELRDRLSRRAAISVPTPHPDVAVTAPSRLPNRAAKRLLDVHDARVSFGGLHAVDGVSLHVDEGSIVGLIGPNGAGKTTLFNAITGLRRLDGGRVSFDGRDVTRQRVHARARLGIGRSFQNLGLMSEESIDRNVMGAQFLGAGYLASDVFVRPWRWWRGERRMRERTQRVLETLDLEREHSRPIEDLQFAAARFVEIAAVVVESPRLLLLDEPTTGLDPAETQALVALLQQLRAQGTTILVIAHDVGFVMSMCDHVYVLAEGRVLTEGPPELVRTDSAVIAAYLGMSA